MSLHQKSTYSLEPVFVEIEYPIGENKNLT